MAGKRARFFALLFVITTVILLALTTMQHSSVSAASITQGSLQVVDAKGKATSLCPLEHTDVKAVIGGFLARVTVIQEFENPLQDKIEAIYTFPLPQNAAVDDMTLWVGDRVVRGTVKRREEAAAIYQAARAAGHVASLLDQERPNIFTQSVANIMPGEKVKVSISYIERLNYEDGSYEFVFPMVVGPRYIPAVEAEEPGNHDGTRLRDVHRITPPVTPAKTRAGHDVSLELFLDAALPVSQVRSVLHEVDIKRTGPSSGWVRLKDKAVIPNKDFIVKYAVAGQSIEDGLLAHRSGKGGFFLLLLQPPQHVAVEDVTHKELVFVLDTSGSMSGFPIEKAKETMRLAMEGLYPHDTFNLITFSGDTHILFPKPVPATRENLEEAQKFLETRSGSGGTEMMKAIRAALEPSDSQDHVRIVCFMTDGYVGNDMEIIAEVQKHPNARVFAFGIGSAVNRFLLDKMAEYGHGEVQYVTLQDDGSAAARRFHERVRKPLLTDISMNWNGLPVSDIYPARVPDLFSAKPVTLCGRFDGAAHGVIELNGRMGGRPFSRKISIDFPQSETQYDVLASLWARMRIDDLMGRDFEGIQHGKTQPEIQEEITQIGLQYRLMTQFTSFVAVEEVTITDGGVPRRIEVPVEMPEGVSYEGIFGGTNQAKQMSAATFSTPAAIPREVPRSMRANPNVKVTGSGAAFGSGVGGNAGGVPGGVVGGVLGGSPGPIRETDSQLSNEQREHLRLVSKLDPTLVAIVERLEKKKPAGPEEVRLVKNGKAEIRIWLAQKSDEVMRQLKQLGLEIIVETKTANLVIGWLPIEKLADLAKIADVRYAAPSQK